MVVISVATITRVTNLPSYCDTHTRITRGCCSACQIFGLIFFNFVRILSINIVVVW